jgi:hypothetical protein
MNCLNSRLNPVYISLSKYLKNNCMTFPTNNITPLKNQDFYIFYHIFGLIYCIDACQESQNTYKRLFVQLGDHCKVLTSMYNQGWRVVYFCDERMRILKYCS